MLLPIKCHPLNPIPRARLWYVGNPHTQSGGFHHGSWGLVPSRYTNPPPPPHPSPSPKHATSHLGAMLQKRRFVKSRPRWVGCTVPQSHISGPALHG